MSEEQLEPQENPIPQEKPVPQASPPPPPPPQTPFPPNNGGGFGGQFGGNFGMQQSLPNATAVLVLGILSIVTCCCYGIVGVILAIIALVLSKKDRELYSMNTGAYTESSYKNLNAGRVCAIIGLILSILDLLMYIALFAMFGFGVLKDPGALQEAIRNLQ